MPEQPALRLSDAQRAMLRAVKETGDWTSHLRERSQFGGAVGTRRSLVRMGLLDKCGDLTPAGAESVR